MASFRLRALRQKKGVSFADFAKKISISESTLSRWELGTSEPDYQTLQELAVYFDVSTDYLLGKTDDPRPFPTEDARPINEKLKEDKFAFALYDHSKDLTEAEKQEILDLYELIKMKRERDKKEKEENKKE